ncbi:MAG: hypothetical protein IPI85_09235 [Dehalococcoidia bacterium]|nr:hypothetical protein [Dehalococcoidia bacterium]
MKTSFTSGRVRSEAGHRVEEGLNVVPFCDPAVPEEHSVAFFDAGDDTTKDAAARREGPRRDAVGDNIDDATQRRVPFVDIRRDEREGHHHADPHVALAFIGTEDEVGEGELEVDVGAVAGHPGAAPLREDVAPGEFHPLDVEGGEGIEREAGLPENASELGREVPGDGDIVGGGEESGFGVRGPGLHADVRRGGAIGSRSPGMPRVISAAGRARPRAPASW